MTKIKIGVIGTINKDSVTLPDGNSYHGWGGILYNLMVLSDELKKHADIFPVCNIGSDCYAPIMKILKRLPSVKTDFIRRVPERNNHCRLTYHDSETKSEILEGGVPPLRYRDIDGLLNFEVVLLNFISGRDVDLRSLGKFCRRFGGIVYTDVHSYTLGKRADGRRFLRVPPFWTTVVDHSHVIQMNRREFELLSGVTPGSAKPATCFRMLEKRLSMAGVETGRRLFIVTDGPRGAYVFERLERRLSSRFFPARGGRRHGDTTGCGDCFGAGFIANFLKYWKISQAMKAGNRAAARRIQGKYSI